MRAVRVFHLEHPHVRMPGGDAGLLLEGYAEKPGRHVERGLDDAVELEIGLQFRLVEGVALGAQLFGIVAPVPGGEGLVRAGLARKAFEFALVVGRAGAGLFPNRLQKPENRFGRLGHRVVELKCGIAFIAEQLRLFGAQGQRLGHEVCIRFLAARGEAAPGLLAQIAARRIGGEGLVDGA